MDLKIQGLGTTLESSFLAKAEKPLRPLTELILNVSCQMAPGQALSYFLNLHRHPRLRIPSCQGVHVGQDQLAGAGAAVCRYNYTGSLEDPEHSSTAHLTTLGFHQWEDYTRLVF